MTKLDELREKCAGHTAHLRQHADLYSWLHLDVAGDFDELLTEATRLQLELQVRTARVAELEGACKKLVDALGGTCDFKECPQCQAYLACEAALKETEQ